MNTFDLHTRPVANEPFPHVLDEHFLAPETYVRLRDSFPECPPSTGPTGYSLYAGDDAYETLLASEPAWRALYDALHSQAFIDWAVAQFADVWKREGLRIDLDNARYVPYREDRIDKERMALRNVEHAPDELWVRLDIHQGRPGYARRIHRDHARRLISMLVYFCDQDANGIRGGELLLHSSRFAWWPKRPVKVTPRENMMVAFPCGPSSHHSVPLIEAMTKPRNYIQVHISSSVDIWPR